MSDIPRVLQEPFQHGVLSLRGALGGSSAPSSSPPCGCACSWILTPDHDSSKLLNDVFQENVEVSFDLPEHSPLATLSIIDLNSSQVTSPRGPVQFVALPALPSFGQQRCGAGQALAGAGSCPIPGGPGDISTLWQLQVLPGSLGADRRGLLWILDEEVLVPGSGDSAAFDRLCSYFTPKGPDQDGKLGAVQMLPYPQLLSFQHHHLVWGIKEWLGEMKCSAGCPLSCGPTGGGSPMGTGQ